MKVSFTVCEVVAISLEILTKFSIFSISEAVNNLFLGEGRHTIAICYIASTSEKKVISTILISHPSRYQ